MRPALAIAGVNVRRMLRDRANIFFVFVFPLALVLLIGLAFGGGTDTRVAVHVPDSAGAFAADLVAEIEDADAVVDRYASADAVREAVSRGVAGGGLIVPPDYSTSLAAGDDVAVVTMVRPDRQAVRPLLDAAVADQSNRQAAARAVADATGTSIREALPAVDQAASQVPGVTVATSSTGDGLDEAFAGLGTFDLGASSNLTLFVFITSMAGGSALIQVRRLGLTRRMLAAPVRTRTILAGEALGRFGVAMVQGIYIMIGTLLLFGVDWGDPAGALLVLVLFAAVGTGAAMLIGALFDNDQQAAGIGVMVALGLGALGGSMVPLDLFSPTLQQIGHLTPHAWAYDAFAALVREDGTVLDILPELGVLAAYAAVLLAVASLALHRAITRA